MAEYQSWLAMKKFADDDTLTNAEWDALSALTLIDRSRLVFEPGNIRWAATAAERAENLRFYQAFWPRAH